MNIQRGKMIEARRDGTEKELRKKEEAKAMKGGFLAGGVEKEEAYQKVAKYKVNWDKAKQLGFNVARERYFSWLVGHSKKFNEQVRQEIIEDIMEKEIPGTEKGPHAEIERELFKASLEKTLAKKGADELLKTRGKIVTKKIEKSFEDRNAERFNKAFNYVTTRILSNIPGKSTYAVDQDKFKEEFINSTAFRQAGGLFRDIDDVEMSNLFLNYLIHEANYLTDEDVDELIAAEKEMIAAIKDGFNKEGNEIKISPQEVDDCIRLWQEKTGFKKGVDKYSTEVDRFIERAYVDAEQKFDKMAAKMPRKEMETIDDYVIRLIMATEKQLTDTEKTVFQSVWLARAAELTHERQEQLYLQIPQKIKMIERKKGEMVDQYIGRVYREASSKISKDMMHVFEEVFAVFSNEQKNLDNLIRVQEQIEDNPDFKIFDARRKEEFWAKFNKAVDFLRENSVSGRLPEPRLGAIARLMIQNMKTHKEEDFPEEEFNITYEEEFSNETKKKRPFFELPSLLRWLFGLERKEEKIAREAKRSIEERWSSPSIGVSLRESGFEFVEEGEEEPLLSKREENESSIGRPTSFKHVSGMSKLFASEDEREAGMLSVGGRAKHALLTSFGTPGNKTYVYEAQMYALNGKEVTQCNKVLSAQFDNLYASFMKTGLYKNAQNLQELKDAFASYAASELFKEGQFLSQIISDNAQGAWQNYIETTIKNS